MIATRTEDILKTVEGGLKQAVEIGDWKQYPETLDVNSTEVAQKRGSVTFSAERLRKEIELVVLSPDRRKHIASNCDEREVRSVRSMTEKSDS